MMRMFVFLVLVGSVLFVARPAVASEARSITLPPNFSLPELAGDSPLSRAWYGRLADFANVYAEPSLSAPIVRNVGDGYIFASLITRVEAEGQVWYKINPGEYVLETDVRLATPTEFSGVIVNEHPARAFGWIVSDIRPSSEPDGEPNPDFERLQRYDFFEVFEAQVGADDWVWYNIGDGRWIRQTSVSLVEINRRPRSVPRDAFWVQVDLYEQSFAAYEGDRMVYAGLVSSGLNRWPTREGLFQVWSRYARYKMSGAEGQIDYYFIEDVPYIMYFDDDIGLHGAYWHDSFGFKHSHGCVNMVPLDAEWLYNWSTEAPDDLWVWVHTSDPHNVFGGQQRNGPRWPPRISSTLEAH